MRKYLRTSVLSSVKHYLDILYLALIVIKCCRFNVVISFNDDYNFMIHTFMYTLVSNLVINLLHLYLYATITQFY